MNSKTKTEYLIQRDYGTECNHLWLNHSTMCNYENAKAYTERSACRGKYRILKREVTDWEVVQ